MIGAARLDPAVYEEVEHDESATSQALLVVVLSSVAVGIGSIGAGIDALIYALVGGLVAWVAYACVAYWVGTNWFKGPETSATPGELLRTLGFASSPRVLLILLIVPVLGWLVFFAVFIWTLITTVIAIRQALDFDTGRAIATAAVSLIPLFVIQMLIAAVAS
jgi:hypothetical protein